MEGNSLYWKWAITTCTSTVNPINPQSLPTSSSTQSTSSASCSARKTPSLMRSSEPWWLAASTNGQPGLTSLSKNLQSVTMLGASSSGTAIEVYSALSLLTRSLEVQFASKFYPNTVERSNLKTTLTLRCRWMSSMEEGLLASSN